MAEKPNPNSEETEEKPETPKEETLEETPEEGLEGEGTPEKTPPEGKESTPAEGEKDIDYKKRYADSSREATRLSEENKDLKTQIEGLSNRPTPPIEAPSEQELSEIVPNWDLMSPTEQSLQKEQVILKRELSVIKKTLGSTSGQLKWEKDFSELAEKEEFIPLLTQKKEFNRFCEQNSGAKIEVLARSFLFNDAKTIGAKEEKVKLERKGLETGSGGPKAPAKQTELTPEEEDKLRTTNPKEYKRLLKKGIIK